MNIPAKFFLIAAFAALPSLVSANCIGSGSFYTCNDASGNSYTVQRYGNTTSVQGYNSQTGSTWSQDSHSYGNTTQTYGRSATGDSWNSTTIRTPGMSNTFGMDAQGNSFSSTCTSSGCW
jgi:hypothetical protein